MGELAKIEAKKNSSDSFSGCAPIDWIVEKAADFAEWVGKGIYNLGQQLVRNVTSFFGGAWDWLREAGQKLVNAIPGIKEVQKSFGVMVAIGKSVADAAGGCIRSALVGLGIAGVVAGGAAAISALGGVGALLGGIAVVGIVGTCARWFLRGIGRAYTFNFNITDKEIQNRYKAQQRAIAASLGSVVGTSLATLACGVAPGAAVTVINPLALALVKETVADGWDEIKGNLRALMQITAGAVQEWIVLETFRNVRSAIKKAAANGVLGGILPPKIKNKIAGWGAEGSKPWSFAEKVEETIEAIPNPNVQAFTEEAVEEFLDVCGEQTYSLTYAF